LNSYRIENEIIRPKLNLEDLTEGSIKLHIIPLLDKINGKTISKSKLLKILDFLFFCCYGDYYSKTDERHVKYQKYLKEKYANYVDVLPEKIKIK
jgi:hypothetical protein